MEPTKKRSSKTSPMSSPSKVSRKVATSSSSSATKQPKARRSSEVEKTKDDIDGQDSSSPEKKKKGVRRRKASASSTPTSEGPKRKAKKGVADDDDAYHNNNNDDDDDDDDDDKPPAMSPLAFALLRGGSSLCFLPAHFYAMTQLRSFYARWGVFTIFFGSMLWNNLAFAVPQTSGIKIPLRLVVLASAIDGFGMTASSVTCICYSLGLAQGPNGCVLMMMKHVTPPVCCCYAFVHC